MVIKRWKDKTYSDLLKRLEKASTEEDVKTAYLKYFELESSTKDRHDTYTKEILFEFKYDVNFDNIGQRAKVLAQALYYVRELKYSE
jgi:hypothetical protein